MTQTQQILAHLEKGRTLTPHDALQRFGCFRLAARVHDLECAGHRINRRIEKKDGKQFARYWLA